MNALRTRPVAATFARLRMLDGNLAAEVGRPQGDGWHALDTVVDDGRLDAWLENLAADNGGQRDVAGAYLGSWLAGALVHHLPVPLRRRPPGPPASSPGGRDAMNGFRPLSPLVLAPGTRRFRTSAGARSCGGALLLVLALLAAACGGDGPSTAGPGEAGPQTQPETTVASAFPVTIGHALGETTIEAEPRRVVTVSASNQDVALALGVTPVAMPFVDYGDGDEGVLPWVRDAIEASGDDFPSIIGSSTNEVAFEAIAGARPDLILATYSGITAEEYATLSEIAPVVAYPDAPYATPWQEQTRIAGQALGRNDEAKDLIAGTEALLASAVDEHPELRDKSLVYTGGIDGGQLGLFRPSDVRVALLEDLGLTLAPYVEDNAPDDESVYYTISLEQAPEIASDLVVAFFGTPELEAAFSADPFVQRLPAFATGAYAVVVGEAEVVASSAPSVLSIPWVLDDYLSVLAEAAAAAENGP